MVFNESLFVDKEFTFTDAMRYYEFLKSNYDSFSMLAISPRYNFSLLGKQNSERYTYCKNKTDLESYISARLRYNNFKDGRLYHYEMLREHLREFYPQVILYNFSFEDIDNQVTIGTLEENRGSIIKVTTDSYSSLEKIRNMYEETSFYSLGDKLLKKLF